MVGVAGEATVRLRPLNGTGIPQLLARLASLLRAVPEECTVPLTVPPLSILVTTVTFEELVGKAVANGEFLEGAWKDSGRRRCCDWVCVTKLVIPSVGEPSGEGLNEFIGGDCDETEEGVEMTCSVNAVVAIAFATPLEPAKGIRPPENLEEFDTRVEAREPGLSVLGLLPWCGVEVEPARAGEGGGGGELAGDGVLSPVGKGLLISSGLEIASCGASPCPAWASKRDNDEGPEGSGELTRGGDGKSLEVGGRVTVKVSSTSASGGPAGGPGIGTGDVTSKLVFLVGTRRFE